MLLADALEYFTPLLTDLTSSLGSTRTAAPILHSTAQRSNKRTTAKTELVALVLGAQNREKRSPAPRRSVLSTAMDDARSQKERDEEVLAYLTTAIAMYHRLPHLPLTADF